MSFSEEVKKELTETEYSYIQKVASVSAILRSSSEFVLKNLGLSFECTTKSEFIAKHIIKTMKDLFDVNGEILEITSENLFKKIYKINVAMNKQALEELDFLEGLTYKETLPVKLINDEEGIKGYLRGLFILAGSVNDPSTTKYHLEIKLSTLEYAKSCLKLINKYKLNAKITENKNKHVIYLKKAESISDFLKIIGVTKAVLYYEDVRISRDMYNNTNRLVNCDIANTKKTLETANKQLNNINYLQNVVGLENLPSDLIDICILRIENKEASLNELIEKSDEILGYTLTKSGLNHRFRKLNEYTNKIKEVRNE